MTMQFIKTVRRWGLFEAALPLGNAGVANPFTDVAEFTAPDGSILRARLLRGRRTTRSATASTSSASGTSAANSSSCTRPPAQKETAAIAVGCGEHRPDARAVGARQVILKRRVHPVPAQAAFRFDPLFERREGVGDGGEPVPSMHML